MKREKCLFFGCIFPGRGYSYMFTTSNEEEEPSAPTDEGTRFSSLEAKLDAFSLSFEALAHKFDARSSARPTLSQNSDLEEDFLPAENDDLYDPAENVIRTKRVIFLTRTSLRTVKTSVLKSMMEWQSVLITLAQLSKIQAKYLRPKNCEYFESP